MEETILFAYQKYRKLLFNIINGIIKEELIAEDILQEQFLTIWEKRDTIQINSSFRSYLIRSAFNRSLNYLRDTKHIKELIILDNEIIKTTQINPEIENILNEQVLRQHVQFIKLQMSRKTRSVFILSRSFKMTNKEISRYMRISVKGVEKHISIALDMFKEIRPYFFSSSSYQLSSIKKHQINPNYK